jgi:hypothetical protein
MGPKRATSQNISGEVEPENAPGGSRGLGSPPMQRAGGVMRSPQNVGAGIAQGHGVFPEGQANANVLLPDVDLPGANANVGLPLIEPYEIRVLPLSLTEILTGGGLDHHPKYLYNTYRGGSTGPITLSGRRSRRGSGVIRSWRAQGILRSMGG